MIYNELVEVLSMRNSGGQLTYRVAQQIWHNYFVRLNFAKC